MTKATARMIEVVLWWLLLIAVWISTISSITVVEVSVAAGSAAPCAAMAVLTRRRIGISWRPRLSWLRWIPPLAVSVLTDTARVLLLPWRHLGRRLRRQPFRGDLRGVSLPQEARPRAGARRALGGWVLSLTPGSYVADADPEELAFLVHTVVDSRPDMIERVRG